MLRAQTKVKRTIKPGQFVGATGTQMDERLLICLRCNLEDGTTGLVVEVFPGDTYQVLCKGVRKWANGAWLVDNVIC